MHLAATFQVPISKWEVFPDVSNNAHLILPEGSPAEAPDGAALQAASLSQSPTRPYPMGRP